MRAEARAGILTAAVIAADQLTKALVRGGVDRGEHKNVFPGVDLVNERNPGVAFGFLGGGGAVVVILAAVALVALLIWFSRNRTKALAWLPTGLLIGGAVGNVIDRIHEGSVTDFIDLPLWPPFNVADACITFGVLALLYVLEGPKKDAG